MSSKKFKNFGNFFGNPLLMRLRPNLLAKELFCHKMAENPCSGTLFFGLSRNKLPIAF
jgi:hypothetical protein